MAEVRQIEFATYLGLWGAVEIPILPNTLWSAMLSLI